MRDDHLLVDLESHEVNVVVELHETATLTSYNYSMITFTKA